MYLCAHPGDAHCSRETAELPSKLAVGSRFRLAASDDFSGGSVRPTSPDLVLQTGRDFEFLTSGRCAFVALDRDQRAYDFVHLLAAEASALVLEDARGQRVSHLTLGLGERATVRMIPLDGDEVLAGTFTYEWYTSHAGTVEFAARTGPEAELKGAALGSTTLMIRTRSLSTPLEVTVVASPTIPDAGAPPGTPPANSSEPGGDAGGDAPPSDGGALPDADAAATTTGDATGPLGDSGPPPAALDASVPGSFADAGDAQ